MEIIKYKTKEQVTGALAIMLRDQVRTNPDSVLGLATGSTPTLAYHELVKDYLLNQTDYSRVVTFNLDEYIGLEVQDRNSYRTFMNVNLFNYINIKTENTFLPSLKGSEGDYSYYDKLISEYGGIDLQVLGIGENGHIGFNEPGTEKATLTHKVTLAENTRINNSVFFDSIDEVPKEALTMGISSIMNAKKIVMAITGEKKAEILKRLIEEEVSTSLPASFLKEHGNVVVLVDEDAASLLKEN